jgi:hypothetical protein
VVSPLITLRGQRDDVAKAGGGADERVERRRPHPVGRDLSTQRVVGQLELVAQPHDVLQQRVALGRPAHHQRQLLGLPGLGEEVVDVAGVDRLHEAVHVGVGGEDDPQGLGRDSLTAAQQLDPRHARHALVGHDDRHLLAAQHRERLLAAPRAKDPEVDGEDRLQRVEHARLVVHDEHGRRRLRRHRRLRGHASSRPAIGAGVRSGARDSRIS